LTGLFQGEAVATIRLLNEAKATYPEPNATFTLTKFDGATITIGIAFEVKRAGAAFSGTLGWQMLNVAKAAHIAEACTCEFRDSHQVRASK
jgi:hypothetical protein